MSRDLKADLELCNRATSGPWDEIQRKNSRLYVGTKEKPVADVCNLYGAESEANLQFISKAREGWPHAIERAMESEEIAKELLKVLGPLIRRQINECGFDVETWDVYQRAKEVLGDRLGEV